MTEGMIIGVFSAVIAVCLGLAWLFGRSKPTIQSFFWGEQKLRPGLVTSLLLSSSFSLNGLLYQTWLGFQIGWWSLLVQVVWCAGFLFLVFNAHKFRTLLAAGTMHGVIGTRFGPPAAKLAAFASVTGFCILIGWEAVVGATVLKNFSDMGNVAYFALPLVIVFIASLYTGAGGLRGNASINFLQNAVKVIALVAALWVVLSVVGWANFKSSPAAGTGFLAATIALGGVALGVNLTFSLFWQVVDMSAWQNIAATPQDDRQSALWWSMGWVLFFPGVIGTFLGIGLSALRGSTAGINDSNILNSLVEAVGNNAIVGPLVVAAFAASMLSTIDGYALAASQASTWDLIFPEKVRKLLALGSEREPTRDDAQVLTVGRVLVLLLAMLGAAGVLSLVLFGGVSLFDLVYAVVVAQMSLVGPVLFCLCRPEGARFKLGYLPILFGLLLGGGFVLARLWGRDDLYTWAPVAAVTASVLLTILVSFFKEDEPVPTESGAGEVPGTSPPAEGASA